MPNWNESSSFPLQVKNIIYHAVKDSIAVLRELEPEDKKWPWPWRCYHFTASLHCTANQQRASSPRSNLLWLDIKLVWPAKTLETGIIVHSVVKTNGRNNLCGSTFLLCFFCRISTLVDGSCNNVDQLHCWQGHSGNGQMRTECTASLMDPCLACFRQKQKCYRASCMVSRAGTPRLHPHDVILVLEISDMTMVKKSEGPMNMASGRSKWLYIHLIQGGIHMPVVLELKAM